MADEKPNIPCFLRNLARMRTAVREDTAIFHVFRTREYNMLYVNKIPPPNGEFLTVIFLRNENNCVILRLQSISSQEIGRMYNIMIVSRLEYENLVIFQTRPDFYNDSFEQALRMSESSRSVPLSACAFAIIYVSAKYPPPKNKNPIKFL